MTDDRCELLCLDLPRAEVLRRSRREDHELNAAAERSRALADPTRLAAATALGEGDELCVCDLAWVLERAPNLVSHHLRTLRTAGLVSSRRQGKTVMYSLTEDGRELLGAVLGLPVGGRA
ncbi:MAG: ArsR/SmtB family transcription factor [Thermoleophilaceae bacterium]